MFYLAIKLWEVLVWKTYTKHRIEHDQQQLKHQKKYQNAPTETQKKRQTLFTRSIDEYTGKEVPINKISDSTHKENKKKAMEAITPIVDTLKLCLRQNTSLRGHRDSTKKLSRSGKKWSY